MVPNYYKLAEQPFGVTPDPRFLFHSPTHREALASLHYGVSAGRGFTALIAQPGMGKTTLLFDFLSKIKAQARTAFLFQSQYTPQDLLRSLLADLGIDDQGADVALMQRKLIDFLHSEAQLGRQLVVVVDEAQNLDESVLELLRMLSNFETPREKLMHLILVGQPQLAEKLASTRLTQLRQRISIIAQLQPLSAEETRMYIEHRLRVAGYDFAVPLFTKRALNAIARHSEGIPRNINNLCFSAMSLGCALGKRTIDEEVIAEVAEDQDLRKFFATPGATRKTARRKAFLTGLVNSPWLLRIAVPGALLALLCLPLGRTSRSVVTAPAAAPAPATLAVDARSETGPQVTAAPVVPTTSTPVPQPLAAAKSPGASRTIQVLPEETLRQIVVENFGKYNHAVLEQIRELNPSLRDPNYIQAGQKIRIPDSRSTADHYSPAPKENQVPAGAETETP